MATHIKDVVAGVLRQAKARRHIQQQVENVLDEIVDVQTRKHIRVKYIQKKSLILHTQSSAALYNTNLKKAEILEAVQQRIPTIENVVIKVRS